MLIAEWVICNSRFVPNDFLYVLKSRNKLRFIFNENIKSSCKITESTENRGRITAFAKNHGIHCSCRKSQLPWLPWFRDYLLIVPTYREFYPRRVTHLSINMARRRVTSLMRPEPLLLSRSTVCSYIERINTSLCSK